MFLKKFVNNVPEKNIPHRSFLTMFRKYVPLNFFFSQNSSNAHKTFRNNVPKTFLNNS